MGKISVGSYLLNQLQNLGVDHIFGIPGDYVIRFNKQIEEHDIRFINTTREDTAGYIADGYARMRGLGVACITYGVGINIANATAQAYVEGSPLVVISGAASTKEMENHPLLHHLINKSSDLLRDTTQLEIFKQITAAQTVLDDPKTAASEIDRVLTICMEEKKPIYIELPRDIVEQEVEPCKKVAKESSKIPNEIFQEIEKSLKNAKKPLLWLGRDVSAFQVEKELLEIAEKWNIPIISTLLGKCTIDENHPLFMGVYQGGMSREEVVSFVDNCDLALAIGVIMNDVNTGFFTHSLDRNQRIVINREKVRLGEKEYFALPFKELIKNLKNIQIEPFSFSYPQNEQEVYTPKKETPITTKALFHCLQSHITHEHVIATDVGDCLFACADLILSQNSFVASAYYAALGSGIPMAIGAQFGAPQKRVIAVIGDGGCQMSATELTTAIRYHLDPIIIIMNNHGYGTERPLLEGEFNDLLNWNYTAIPQVLGEGVGIHIKTEEECDHAIQHALNNRGTLHILEIELGKLDFSPALNRFKALAKKTV